MVTRTLAQLKAALFGVADKVQRWKNGENRYADLFALAEYRQELGNLNAELRALDRDQPIDEETKVGLALYLHETVALIDSLVVGSFYMVLVSLDVESLTNANLPYSLQMLDNLIISLVVMNLETKESLTVLLKQCLDFMAMMLDMKTSEEASIYRNARFAYKAVKSRGQTKYGFDFGTDPLL